MKFFFFISVSNKHFSRITFPFWLIYFICTLTVHMYNVLIWQKIK